MLRRYASAALCLFAAISAPAAEWIKVKSPNIELYTTAGERDARETLEAFEQVRDFFMRANSSRVTTRLPVTVVGFRNAKEYKPYAASEIAAAYYTGDEQRDYIVMSGLGAEQTPMAVHEYMHLLVRHSGLKLPSWLNEGFAEVYSTIKPMGGQILVGAVPPGRAASLQAGKWIPLPRLFEITHDSTEFHERESGSMLYAESWLLTHMLALEDAYRDKFPAFAAAASASGSTPKALEQVYGKTVPQIEKDLRAYMHSNSLKGVLFQTKFAKIAVAPAEPASDLAVNLTLAKLTALLNHYDQALERYRELAATHKDSYEIEDALAYLYWRKGDAGAARSHLARATALGDPSWKTWWDYARLLDAASERGPELRTALHKTVELAPDLVDARLMLAGELYRSRAWAQVIAQLNQVKSVDHERAPAYFLMLAHSSLNIDRRDDAKRYAESARKFAVRDSDRESAEQLLAYLDRPAPVSDSRSRVESFARADLRPIEDPGVPALRRKEAPAVTYTEIAKPAPGYVTVKGQLKRFDCLGPVARIQVQSGATTLSLLLRKPNEITIRSGGGKSVDMTCGPQNTPVSVDYVPNPDARRQTSGDVYAIEFLGQ